MEVGAVANIDEYVLGRGKRRLAQPGGAFTAHVGEGGGVAIHPYSHVVTPDSGQRARAGRYDGRNIVGTT